MLCGDIEMDTSLTTARPEYLFTRPEVSRRAIIIVIFC
jgi:hypothetical protein